MMATMNPPVTSFNRPAYELQGIVACGNRLTESLALAQPLP
jgi:hypothetical protein